MKTINIKWPTSKSCLHLFLTIIHFNLTMQMWLWRFYSTICPAPIRDYSFSENWREKSCMRPSSHICILHSTHNRRTIVMIIILRFVSHRRSLLRVGLSGFVRFVESEENGKFMDVIIERHCTVHKHTHTTHTYNDRFHSRKSQQQVETSFSYAA